MRSPSRRALLRGLGASLVAPALAGCAAVDSGHHQPHLLVDNDDATAHRVSVRVEGPDEVVLDRTLELDADADREFEGLLPAHDPDDPPEVDLTVTVDDRAPHRETRQLGSGAHSLWVTVLDGGTVDVTYVVH